VPGAWRFLKIPQRFWTSADIFMCNSRKMHEKRKMCAKYAKYAQNAQKKAQYMQNVEKEHIF
jgi:hypothetical protein